MRSSYIFVLACLSFIVNLSLGSTYNRFGDDLDFWKYESHFAFDIAYK